MPVIVWRPLKSESLSSSKYFGVYRHHTKWQAYVINSLGGGRRGLHDTEEAAAIAANQAELSRGGQFAYLNPIGPEWSAWCWEQSRAVQIDL